MSDEVTLRMTLDEAQAVAAIQRVINRQKQQEKGVEDVGKKYKEAAKEAAQASRDAERFAARVKDTTATPLEKVASMQARLNDLVKRGLLDQKQAGDYLDQYRGKMQGVAQAGQKTFGADALASVGQFATGLLSVSAALGIIKQGLELVAAAREKALASSESLDTANRDLASLYQTPGDFQAGLAARDAAAQKYGIQRQEASRIQFMAVSGGFNEEDTRTAFELAQVTDAESAANLMLKSQEMFGGQVTRRQAANIAFKAAADSPLEVQDISRYLPTAAVSARSAGFGMEETTALMTTLTERFKGPEQASDRLGTFLSRLALADKKYQGMEGLEKLLGDQSALKKFTGDSKELNEVSRVLQTDLEKAKQRTQGLRAASAKSGQQDDAIANAIRIRFSAKEEQAKLTKRQAEIEAEIARDQRFTVTEAERLRAASQQETKIEKEQRNWAYRTGSWLGSGLGRLTGSARIQTAASEAGGELMGGSIARNMLAKAPSVYSNLEANATPQGLLRNSGAMIPFVTHSPLGMLRESFGQLRERMQGSPAATPPADKEAQTQTELLRGIHQEVKAGNGVMRGRETQSRAQAAGGSR